MLTDAEITDILSHYAVGTLLASRALTQGSVQTNLLLDTTKGKFVLRYYRQNRSLQAVQFEVNLIAYLKRHGYPCAAVLKNRAGKLAGETNGKPYALFEFLEGSHIEQPTALQQQQLIEQVAELHKLTRNYRPTFAPFRWNYGVALCQRLSAEIASEIGAEIDTANAQAKLHWYRQELSQLVLPRSLPKGVCHADFHFSNVLFKDGNFHALIDFDDANYTYLTYDLAALIEPFIPAFRWDTWSNFSPEAHLFDFAEARWIVAIYQQYRPLNPTEKRYFFDVYKLGVFLDCLWYFKRGEVADFYERRKIEALNRLGREQFCAELFG